MKDAKGHGSNKRGGGMPIPGHEYHTKTNEQLRYISKDAADAARATRGMTMYDPNSHTRQDTEGKYLDQLNNAASVLGYRARGGTDFSDKTAATELSTGHPKSGVVPVHAGADGRSDFGPGHTVSQVTLGGKVKSTQSAADWAAGKEPRAIGINRPWRE